MQNFAFPALQDPCAARQQADEQRSDWSGSSGSLRLVNTASILGAKAGGSSLPLTMPVTPACKSTVLIYCKRPACGQVLALLKAAGATGIRTKYVAERATNTPNGNNTSTPTPSPTGSHMHGGLPPSPMGANSPSSTRGFLAVESTLTLEQVAPALKSLSVATRAAATFRIPPEVNPRCRLHIAAYVLNEPAGVKNLKKPFVVHTFKALGVDPDTLRKIRVQRSRHRGVYDIQAEFGTPEMSVTALKELHCGHAFIPVSDPETSCLEVVVSGEYSDRCGTLKVERETADGVMSGDPEWYDIGMGHLYTNGRWKDWTPSIATCFALADQPPKLMDVELADLVDDILLNTEEDRCPPVPTPVTNTSLSTRSMPPPLFIPRRASLDGPQSGTDSRPSNPFPGMTPVAACGTPTFIHSSRASDCTTVGPYSPSACDGDRIERTGRMSITSSSQASPPLSPERFVHPNPVKSSASSCSSGSTETPSLHSIAHVPLIPAKPIRAPLIVCPPVADTPTASSLRPPASPFAFVRYPECSLSPHSTPHATTAAPISPSVQLQLESIALQRQMLAAQQDALANQQQQLLNNAMQTIDITPVARW